MRLLSRFAWLTLAVLSAACSKSKIENLVPDKNNGGITLPEKFGAVVVVDSVGRGRHIAVGSNGDIYLHLSRLALDDKGIIALRDSSGDGRADIIKGYSGITGTGIEAAQRLSILCGCYPCLPQQDDRWRIVTLRST